MTDDISTEEIDELAQDIEETIRDGRELMADLPDFEMGRRERDRMGVIGVNEILAHDGYTG